MRFFLRGLFVAVIREIHPNKLFLCNTALILFFFFAVEDSGAVHPEAHQFLRSHARLVSPDNPGRELGHSLTSLSVSIQAARAKSVTTARDLLSVDALPPQPYINGVLPIIPPPAWLASVIPPRRYAVMPFPERPHHVPEPIAY